MTSDWSSRVFNGYARPSGAATFAASRQAGAGLSSPVFSDPNTGAVGISTTATPPSSSAASNVALVVGLFLLTMWLESGRKGSVL